MQRRLAVILSADVVEYSRLMAADEAGTFAQLKTLRKKLIEPETSEYNGHVIASAGTATRRLPGFMARLADRLNPTPRRAGGPRPSP